MATTYFQTEAINLSMRSPETGAYLTSNVYTLEGVLNEKGELRQMSIGQLVMAVCLRRATKLESDIVQLMEQMAEKTDALDRYSKIEADLAAWQRDNPTANLPTTVDATKYAALAAVLNDATKWGEFLDEIEYTGSRSAITADLVDDIMQKMEAQMDDLNTVNQELLIDIQSQTSKRDDTYSLISNIEKSLTTVMTGIANNM